MNDNNELSERDKLWLELVACHKRMAEELVAAAEITSRIFMMEMQDE